MKILHISKFYAPYRGGIENVVGNLVEGSLAQGNHVDVLCFNNSFQNSNESFKNHNIFRARKLFTLFSLPISFSYLVKIFKIINNYDIIHIHLPNPMSVLAICFCDIKAKIVIHWHSDIVEQKALYLLLENIHRKALQKANKIILTSNNYLESSQQLFNFKYKCEVIPIGIKDNNDMKVNNSSNKIFNSKDEIIVFSIGRLVNYKGFDLLIRSSKYLNKNFKIMIGGNGPLKNKLQKLIEDIGVTNTVSLMGHLSESELINCYKNADIFCLPSKTRNEAYGVVLLEAMSFSLPIVCFDIEGSGVPWVAKNKYNSLVVDEINAYDLSKALNLLGSDIDLLKQYSLNSRRRFEEYFTSAIMQKRISDLYEEI